jgi:hypothetical protein
MRPALALTLAFLLCGCASAPLEPAAGCDPSLWKHIYHSYRLEILNPCIQATGTVDAIRREADGDLHVLVHLDAGQALTNEVNDQDQHGGLVVEPVCVHPPTQTDAKPSCEGFVDHSGMTGIRVGDHVAVLGAWVLDHEHGWNEIHPVTRIWLT